MIKFFLRHSWDLLEACQEGQKRSQEQLCFTDVQKSSCGNTMKDGDIKACLGADNIGDKDKLPVNWDAIPEL